LRTWVEREGSTRTIEIGLGFGVSTLFICDGLTDDGPGAHTAIDPLQTEAYAGRGIAALEDAGVRDRVTVIEEPSELVLPRLRAATARFDLAFVDGNHRFEHVFMDLIHLGHLVKPGGVVFVDDVQLPAVRKAVAFTTSNLGWFEVDHGEDGDLHRWSVLRTPAEPPARAFDAFNDF
jgi:predicted O-methyltransferase YrrM